MSQVCAWLDAGGAIDAKDCWGYTLLASCAFGKEIEGQPGARIIIEEEVALARNLIELRAAGLDLRVADLDLRST